MKRQHNHIANLALVGFLLLLVSCATFNQTVVSVTEIVDSATKEYASLYNRGMVPPDVASQVAVAHLEYRKTAAVLHDAYVAVKEGREDNTKGAFIAVREAANRFIDVVALILTKDKTASFKAQLQKASKP